VQVKRFTLALAASLGLIASLPTTTFAQEEGGQQQATRRTPTIRGPVYDMLSEAQECAEMDDIQCAMERLGRVREMKDLNSYEQAQMWSFYGFIYFGQDQLDQALDAYLQVLKQADIPEGMEIDTMMTVAQLYQATEQYSEALAMLNRWFTVAMNPAPRMYYLKAVLHYQLEQYREGIEPITTAIRLNQERGEAPQEPWYQLLQVFYFELEDYPNLIRTLTTMVELWPKKETMTLLAGIYGQEGEEQLQLALFEAAYEAGWLDRGTEHVSLAQMHLQAGAPFKAAQILQKGLDSGLIESNVSNWRLLAQAWQLAAEDERALPAYSRASSLSDDGELDMRLAQSYANLARWDDCVDSARTALNRNVSRTDQTNMLLGTCLVELRRWNEATEAFRTASRDQRSRSSAQQFLGYIEGEQRRERELNRMLQRG
jgi:tetratricopeptide (TPR) repeat protein